MIVANEPVSNAELPELLRLYQEEVASPIQGGASQLAILLVAGFSAVVFILIIFTLCIYCRYVLQEKVKKDIFKLLFGLDTTKDRIMNHRGISRNMT